jgi:hypothetical protein
MKQGNTKVVTEERSGVLTTPTSLGLTLQRYETFQRGRPPVGEKAGQGHLAVKGAIACVHVLKCP